MTEPVYLQLALPEVNDGQEPPREIRLFARGETPTTKGAYIYSERSEKEILADMADLGRDLVNFDFGHAQLSPFQSADASASGGWAKLDPRADGMYLSDIQWTPRADRGLRDREWRYLSPAIILDAKTREVLKVINVALTNIPATKGQKPLVAAQTPGDGPQEGKPMEEMAKLLGAFGVENASQAVAKLDALRKSEADLMAAAKAQAAELEATKAELAKFHAAQEQEVKASAIAKLPPYLRPWALSQSIEAIESLSGALPKVEEKGVEAPAKAEEARKTLSDEQRHIERLLGLGHEPEVTNDGRRLSLSWNAPAASAKESK